MRAQGKRESLMARLRAAEAPPAWRLTNGVVFVLAYVLFSIVWLLSVSVLADEAQSGAPSARTLMLSALLTAIVITLGIGQWARRKFGERWLSVLRLLAPSRPAALLAILLFGLGIAWTIDLGGRLLNLTAGQIVPPTLEVLRQGEPLAFVLGVLLAVVFQPVADGLLFGGLVYPSVARVSGDNRIGIVAVALLYMLVSLLTSSSQGQWYALIQPFCMMLVVLGVRAYTQSVRAAIVARAAFGVFFVLAALFSAGFANLPLPN
jgi:hypothetical protein